MNGEPPAATRWQRHVYGLFHVVAWVASIGLVVIDLGIVRNVVLDAMTWISVHRSSASRARELSAGKLFGWKIELIEQTMLLVFACVGMGVAVAVEYYYRQAGNGRVLAKRVGTVLGIQTLVALVGLLLQALI